MIIIFIDFQKEYGEAVHELNGQTITISDSTKTYINPLDLDQNYSLSEDGGDSPVKAKVEYMQGWVESIIDEGSLSPIEKTIVDRLYDIFSRIMKRVDLKMKVNSLY